MTRQQGALLAGGVAYSLVLASTTPFTRAADVATAIPIVAVVILAAVRWPGRPHPLEIDAATAHPWRAWVVLGAAVVVWELVEYTARGSRAAHPTLSSMLDAVDRSFPLKAVVCFLWLCLGAAMVRAGAVRRGDGTVTS